MVCNARPLRHIWLVAAFCLAAWPAAANDQALADFIGYSTDFRYFAFEEYGIQDGSGSAYSNIYIVDLRTDAWVGGSPFRVAGHEDDKTLAEARREALDLADAELHGLKIETPVQVAALLGDGFADPGTRMHFGFPYSGDIGATAGDYALALETLAMPPTPACTAAIDTAGTGFILSIASQGATREIHRDTAIPDSRGCPVGYRLYAVVFPYGDGEIANAVAIVASYPVGWEGADRRFLAVPIGAPAR